MINFLTEPAVARGRVRTLFTALFLLLGVASRATSGDQLQEGLGHLQRAWSHAEHDQWEPAAHEAADAAALLRPMGSKSLPEALEVLGLAEVMLRRPAQAAEHLREALAACSTCEERRRIQINLASAYRDLRRFDEATALLRETLQEAEAAGVPEDQALVFKALATVAIVQGRHAEAIPALQEALRRNGAAAKPADRAKSLETLGFLLSETGDGARALDVLRQAEGIYSSLGERPLTVRLNLAKAYRVLGAYDTAFGLCSEVEAESRRNGDQAVLAAALTGAAELFQMRGRYEEAEKRLQEALQIERRHKDSGGEAHVLDDLAHLELLRGRYDLAFSHFEEAVAAFRAAGDGQSELIAKAAGADVYSQLNRSEEAFSRLQPLVERARENAAGNRLLEVWMELWQLFSAGRDAEALERSDQALALARKMGARSDEGKTLVIRAALLFSLGRLDDSRRDAEAARAVSHEIGDRAEEARDEYLLGFILLHAGRPDEARAHLESAVQFQRGIGSSGPLASSLWALGAAHEKLSRTEAAIAAYREAAEISESAFGEVRADDLLAGLAESATGSYARWANLLARKNDVEQSFAVAEKARARAFLRRMGNPAPDLRQGVDPALARQEAGLRRTIESLGRQLGQEQAKALAAQDRDALAALAQKLDSARRDYRTLLIRLQEASPEYASLVHPSPLTLPQVQKLLDGDTTLVEYLLLEDESWAWVIEKDAAHVVRLFMHGDDLAQRVAELRQRIAAREPAAGQAFVLYISLFSPLVPFIHHQNLVVIPHGALHALPFAALTPDAGKTYLIEHHALSTLPSASVLPFVLAKRGPAGGGMLVLGDPDGSLPEAANEARAVAALYGTRALVGWEASAEALRRAPRPIARLHIAAHAAFDPARPLFSHIRLADGDLTVHDIFGLDLRGTELVVVSGCETGRGQPTAGDELEGLSRAFLYAGAGSVVTTQWAVDDASSRAVMEAFYRRLRLRAGTRAAEALRQAQMEILHSNEWRLPFFWAAFSLTGVSSPQVEY